MFGIASRCSVLNPANYHHNNNDQADAGTKKSTVPAATAATTTEPEPLGEDAGEGRRGLVGEPVQVVVEDGAGQGHDDRLEDERAADGDQDAGDLVLHQGAEAQSEEGEQDRGHQQLGHDGTDLIGHRGHGPAHGGIPP